MYADDRRMWVFLFAVFVDAVLFIRLQRGKSFVMHVLEIILIGIGLAMDAFAASICKGLSMKKLNIRHMLIIALYFGGFQALMPLIGWVLGNQFQIYIVSFDHWIAFVLLVFLGLKTIIDTLREKEDGAAGKQESKLDHKELFLLAIATSIDALAVGVTMAFLQVNLLSTVSIIGIITFAICVFGVLIGNMFGSTLKKKASIIGGLILIGIGTKILLEHLGILFL